MGLKAGWVTGADGERVWTFKGSTVWWSCRGTWHEAEVVTIGRANVEVQTADGKKHYVDPHKLCHRNIALKGKDKPE